MKNGSDDSSPSGGPTALTDAGLITLDYFEPADELKPFISTCFYFRCDETDIRDVRPAGVGTLMIFLKGSGAMDFGERSDPSHPVSLLAPLTRAVPFNVEGPFHCIGGALTPLGWAAITGLDASEYRDRLLDAREILGADIAGAADQARDAYLRGAASPKDLCHAMSALVAQHLRPVNQRHAQLIAEVYRWLSQSYNPSVEELARRTDYSIRQVQRQVERYFGVTPKLLIRKYRALRVAALLQYPATTADEADALIDQFYDQSHLIREIRMFAGRTPARLGDSEKPILEHLLDLRSFRDIKPRIISDPGD